MVLGYPLQGVISTSLNMTTGNISALSGIEDDARVVQFTAPIQPGNSGGPLVDASGNVVGVVTSKLSALWAARNVGDLPQNVNFALKVSVVRDFLESRGTDFQARGLGATIPLTDLPAKVSGAVFPLQCYGPATSVDSEPRTVSPAEPRTVEKRPGALIAGYGSPAESFEYIFLRLQNVLTEYGVLVANSPSSMRPVAGGSISVQNLLGVVQARGSDSLLYLTVEHGMSNVHRARLQCFDALGKLLWEEKASSSWTWAMTEQGAASAVVEQLKKKLKRHVGKTGLPLR